MGVALNGTLIRQLSFLRNEIFTVNSLWESKAMQSYRHEETVVENCL